MVGRDDKLGRREKDGMGEKLEESPPLPLPHYLMVQCTMYYKSKGI
jgi:hypothetical protein